MPVCTVQPLSAHLPVRRRSHHQRRSHRGNGRPRHARMGLGGGKQRDERGFRDDNHIRRISRVGLLLLHPWVAVLHSYTNTHSHGGRITLERCIRVVAVVFKGCRPGVTDTILTHRRRVPFPQALAFGASPAEAAIQAQVAWAAVLAHSPSLRRSGEQTDGSRTTETAKVYHG